MLKVDNKNTINSDSFADYEQVNLSWEGYMIHGIQ